MKQKNDSLIAYIQEKSTINSSTPAIIYMYSAPPTSIYGDQIFMNTKIQSLVCLDLS